MIIVKQITEGDVPFLKKGTEKQAVRHYPFQPRKKLEIFLERHSTRKTRIQ